VCFKDRKLVNTCSELKRVRNRQFVYSQFIKVQGAWLQGAWQNGSYYTSQANCNRKIAVISQVQLFDTTSWYSRYHAVLSGPCPRNVNRTVKNTQGDHVLCTSCTDVRFPATRTSTNLGSVVNSSKDVDTRYDTAMDTGQCSESCNYQRAEPSTDHHDRESTTRR